MEQKKELAFEEAVSVINSQAASAEYEKLLLEVSQLKGDLALQLEEALSSVRGDLKSQITKTLKEIKPTRVVHEIKNGKLVKEVKSSQHVLFPLILKCVEHRINVALVGPAGSGKSRVCQEIAKALDLEFSPVSFNILSSKSDILGFVDANGNYHSSPFRERFENGGVFVADEFDACHAGIATILNAAIANKLCTFGDNKTIEAHEDFVFIACMNTFGTGANSEYVGRNRLDAATLDRFAFIRFGYDKELEKSLIGLNAKPIAMSISAGGLITVDEWYNIVLWAREECERATIKAIISPRASMMGAELCESGVGRDHLIEMFLLKGMLAQDRERIVKYIAKEEAAAKKLKETKAPEASTPVITGSGPGVYKPYVSPELNASDILNMLNERKRGTIAEELLKAKGE